MNKSFRGDGKEEIVIKVSRRAAPTGFFPPFF